MVIPLSHYVTAPLNRGAAGRVSLRLLGWVTLRLPLSHFVTAPLNRGAAGRVTLRLLGGVTLRQPLLPWDRGAPRRGEG